MTVCLTGMHRSGTSLVASWLHERGVAMVSDTRVGRDVGPDVGNESGHLEDRIFHRTASEAIERCFPGSDGWRLPDADPGPVGFDRHQVLRLWNHARRRSRGRHGRWGWKDPRSCLCLDAYLRIFPTVRVLGVWRPAAGVVDSLLRRAERSPKAEYAIGADTAVRTWIGYNRRLLASAERQPRRVVIVALADLLAMDAAAADALLARVGLPPGPPIDTVFDAHRLGSDPGELVAGLSGEADRALTRARGDIDLTEAALRAGGRPAGPSGRG